MADKQKEIGFIVSAPGKVILFGEHSVVYKKAAVSTSIGRRLYVKIKTAKDSNFSIKLPQINTELISTLCQFQKVVKEKCPVLSTNTPLTLENPDIIDHNKFIESLKSNLQALGVNTDILPDKTKAALIGFLFAMRGMCHSVECDLIPFSLEVDSDLQPGAGTGSSAAFAVSMSGSILQYKKYVDKSYDVCKTAFSHINDNVVIKSHSTTSGFSLDEMRIINKWAFCIEKIMHGRPSGIDNTTCTFGSVVVTSQEKNQGVLTFRFLENVPKISILLISTGVSRNTSNLVIKVRQLRESNCTAVDAILNAMDIIALEAFKTLDALGNTANIELYKVLGGLMELNHGLLRTLGVSHESLEHIVSVSASYGLSSKLTGAGGGGYAITLVPPNYPDFKIAELKKELGQKFTVTEINIAEEGIKLDQLAE